MHEPPADATGERAQPARLAAIALASFAVLFFQIAATRVLSVVLWYHWAFLSISLAMLGLGVPGVWFALRAPRPRLLPWALLLGGLALPAATAATLAIGNRFGGWSVVAIMACLLVPLLLLGAAVCQLLLEARGRTVARLYGADLLGAATAAAAVVPALSLAPTPHAIAWLGLLPIAAARLVGLHWLPTLGAAAAIAGAVWFGTPFEVRWTKSYDESTLPKVYERWTPTARLTFFDPKVMLGGGNAFFGWGKGRNAPHVAVDEYWMQQDGSAGTPVTRFDGDTSDLREFEHLLYDVTAVGHQVRTPRRVAVIGGGGGRDILTALVAGATDVDAVELNGGVVAAVSGHFREFSGDVYHARGVTAHVSEGRSFLTRSRGGYDLIQISLIDSWAATAAGAFALSENNLYTVEAYRLYLERLAPDGLVATSRWRSGEMGLEASRLLLLNDRALRELGVADPAAHLAVVAAGNVSTVLTSRRAFTAAELDRLRQVCEQRGFDLLFPGPSDPDNPADPATLLRSGPGALERSGLVMAPPTDDTPFFFQTLPVFGRIDLEFARRYGVNSEAVAALQLLMLVLTAATLWLFFVPFGFARRLRRPPGFWRGTGFFAAIGFSFMLIEVPWLQRFVLYLGHPSLAAAVVIGGLLLGAGLGSLRAARLDGDRACRLWWLAPLLLAAGNAGFGPLFVATLGAGEAVRIGITLLLLLPVGFVLGHYFPLGMQRFGDPAKAWFWAVNGACSVLAGVASLALAMTFGFTATAWLGVAGYVAAGWFARR
ncbi:MAG: hypothetical protein JNL08_06110 [Planctomycetes bacterium]|nr:hypothetical protein [Planctomycetota bacterium]